MDCIYSASNAHFRFSRHADQEIRLARDPFPLYPGEVLKKDVTPLTVVPADSALRLRAILVRPKCLLLRTFNLLRAIGL